MVVHPKTKKIWTHEHGPRGGDEINIIEASNNYVGPKSPMELITPELLFPKKPPFPMEQPFYYWVPSIAPSGMAFASSVYPNWEDNLFVGSLKYEYLERLVIKDNKVIKRKNSRWHWTC